jgi:hypothetical protein
MNDYMKALRLTFQRRLLQSCAVWERWAFRNSIVDKALISADTVLLEGGSNRQ